MYLFGLEGSGFIISLGLTLLISGAIMFYILKRFQLLESSIIDHAKILQSFINKSQAQEINNNLASNIALESAIRQQNEIDNKIDNKIEVSDNEEYEEDSESENEIDESDDSDSDNERIEFVDSNILTPELVESVKIIAINDYDELKTDKLLDVNSFEDLGTFNLENNNDNNDDNDDNDDDKNDDDVNESNNSEIIDIIDKKDEKSTNYMKLKILELKELVTSKKLVNENTDINKLKKVDLIKLLQNN